MSIPTQVTSAQLVRAAAGFKVLGNPSRLQLLIQLAATELTVSQLVERSGLSQPLVSQHLRSLRDAGLVMAERHGKEIRYRIADEHVIHVVADALTHADEAATEA